MSSTSFSPQIKEVFETIFPDELTTWLLEEIRLNKEKHISILQRQFWLPPPYKEAHDPRGCPSYVRDYIEPYLSKADDPNAHKPHPNIIDYLRGKENVVSLSCSDLDSASEGPSTGRIDTGDDTNEEDDGSDTPDDDVNIDDEFQIPKSASPLHM